MDRRDGHHCAIAPLIAIVGNIGAGKTTAVRRLSERLGLDPVEEDYRRNPYLERFYSDPPRWAFRSQLWFLTESAAADQGIGSTGAVKELTPYFVHHAMSAALHESSAIDDEDFETLASASAVMAAATRAPDVVVLLTAATGELVRRIDARGREFERRIAPEYLDRISRCYRDAVAGWRDSPVVEVDTGRIDVRTDEGLSAVVSEIAQVAPYTAS